MSVTHQIKIGREDSWVKIGVSTEVRKDESLDTAIDRADRVIQQKIFDVVNNTVAAVNNYEA